MSQNRRNYQKAAYDKEAYSGGGRNRGGYVDGNTVRRLVPERFPEEVPGKQHAPAVRKNREKARSMSFGYVLFLAAAMCAAAFVLINYVQLQGELTQRTKSVASKEVQLNNLKVANDEEYNRIMGSVNLEEIKRIAIGELGMVYAQDGQIVTYKNEKNDYMRKVTESNK